ncbi:DUF3955 domain-containing protein [Aeromonas sobria]|uniref:DUF3955 domain-containing protein n=1 Tax=Aeromonas sobria TaxID=646 RepID=UPI001F00B421|nr:DUF3955 domain-containing protein [Aeromonas sobria]
MMTMMMRIGAVLAAMGLACFVAFELIGSTVDENGTLHEPFGLIPIGFLFVAVGGLLTLPRLIRTLVGRCRHRASK